MSVLQIVTDFCRLRRSGCAYQPSQRRTTSHTEQILSPTLAVRSHRRIAFIGIRLRLVQWRDVLARVTHRIGFVVERRDVVGVGRFGGLLRSRRFRGRHNHQFIRHFHVTAPFGQPGDNGRGGRKVLLREHRQIGGTARSLDKDARLNCRFHEGQTGGFRIGSLCSRKASVASNLMQVRPLGRPVLQEDGSRLTGADNLLRRTVERDDYVAFPGVDGVEHRSFFIGMGIIQRPSRRAVA